MKRLTRYINRLLPRGPWPLKGHAHRSYFAGAQRINRGH